MAVVGDIGLDLTPEGRAAMERLNELADVTIEVGIRRIKRRLTMKHRWPRLPTGTTTEPSTKMVL